MTVSVFSQCSAAPNGEKEPDRYGVGGKYGLVDTVIDGVSVQIDRINVSLQAPGLSLKVNLFDFRLFSPSTDWGVPSSLKDTRVKNKAAGSITLFKQASIKRIDIELATTMPGEVGCARNLPGATTIAREG